MAKCDRCPNEIAPEDEQASVCLNDWVLCPECRLIDDQRVALKALEEWDV